MLGLCNAEEKLALEQLRLQHNDLNNSIISFEKALEANLMANTVTTSAITDNTILNNLKLLNQSNTIKPTQAIVRNFNYKKYVAAASIGLLIASAAYNYFLYSKNKEQQNTIANITKNNSITLPIGDYKILTDPTITPVAMYGVPAHSICRCTLYWDKNTGKAYVMIHHLMPATDGKAYQLWADVDGKKINVGLIDDKIRDRFIEVKGVPEDSKGFLVTLETNGPVSEPTKGQEWLVGKI